jgi:hypothetical protein
MIPKSGNRFSDKVMLKKLDREYDSLSIDSVRGLAGEAGTA